MGLFHQLTIPGDIEVLKLVGEKNSDWHTHDFLEFAYLVQGTAHHVIDGRECVLQPGDFFVVDYHTPHAYTSDGITIINCLFRPEVLHPRFANVHSFNELAGRYFFSITGRHIVGPTADQMFHDADGRVGRLFEQLVEEYEKSEDGYMEMLRNLLCQIIILTVRQVGSRRKTSDLVELITRQIEERYYETITLESICNQYHYSLSYASGRFKEETGNTFTAALQNRRIEEGCRLLLQTKQSVAQIAEQVGYHNVKFFHQVFKRVIGLTPKEFRRQHR